MSPNPKIHTPLPPNDDYFTSDPHALSSLPEGQRAMYNEVLAHFASDSYALPHAGKEGAGLLEKEKFWLSRECLLRYLRASKWKVATAIQRLEATLKWRREYGFYDLLTPEYVEPEAVTGKEILFGFDAKGRPAFYMIPSRQNTEDPIRQNQFAVWMLERGIDYMQPGVETLDLLINFADRAKHPNISQARAFLSIIQDHYPERLGLALVLNIPFYVHLFFKVVMPFVDPITREKVKFNPCIVGEEGDKSEKSENGEKSEKSGLFDPAMVMRGDWGGTRDFEYVHERYWPELVRGAHANAAKWEQRWKALGGTVGVGEWEYKGGRGEGEKDGVGEVDVGEEGETKAPAAVVVGEVVDFEAPAVGEAGEEKNKGDDKDKCDAPAHADDKKGHANTEEAVVQTNVTVAGGATGAGSANETDGAVSEGGAVGGGGGESGAGSGGGEDSGGSGGGDGGGGGD